MELISIIVPCYNEQEVLPLYYEEIKKIMRSMMENEPELSFELLFINDGSKDKTIDILRDMASSDSRVRYISFSRNFGKEAGMFAGLQNAKGDYIVVMDADLQHPPEFIPKMYDYVKNQGYDCATTRRVSRKGESKIRSWFARKFYKLMNKISQTEIVDGAQDFRFMTRQMVDAILDMKEYNRFSKGIFSWVGFSTKYIEYENVERAAGTTTWSFKNLFVFARRHICLFYSASCYRFIFRRFKLFDSIYNHNVRCSENHIFWRSGAGFSDHSMRYILCRRASAFLYRYTGAVSVKNIS